MKLLKSAVAVIALAIAAAPLAAGAADPANKTETKPTVAQSTTVGKTETGATAAQTATDGKAAQTKATAVQTTTDSKVDPKHGTAKDAPQQKSDAKTAPVAGTKVQ